MVRSSKVRAHIRENVVGYLALFVALSGTAYAVDGPLAGQNTVGSADIINGEVKNDDLATDAVGSAKIVDRQVKNADLSIGASSSNTIADGGIQGVDIATGAVSGEDIGNNSVTGDDVHESSLNLAIDGWHEVGTPGEPAFNVTVGCAWSNFDANHNSAAFLRDRLGFVHLKGLVDADDVGAGCDFSFPEDRRIFTLPNGFRPVSREVHATLTNSALGRVNVDGPGLQVRLGDGAVSVEVPEANAEAWISLDGITFRCTPSGFNGCP